MGAKRGCKSAVQDQLRHIDQSHTRQVVGVLNDQEAICTTICVARGLVATDTMDAASLISRVRRVADRSKPIVHFDTFSIEITLADIKRVSTQYQ